MNLFICKLYAKGYIRIFAETNSIKLNEKILETELVSVDECIKSGAYTWDDINNALKKSEACFWGCDYITKKPIIIYDDSRLDDSIETIQTLIHEYLHYSPLSINEGECEVLSLIIAMDHNALFEETIKKKKESLTLPKLMDAYEDSAVAEEMYRALQGTLTIEKVREWLT